jgi:O-succinylbenzoic acid--CoA ligase
MLSVSTAGRDSASRLAVIAGDMHITFEELSARVQELATKVSRLNTSQRPVAFVAIPTLDSLLLFYALLELGQSALPMNPRLLASDHQAMIEQAGAIEVSVVNGELSVTNKASSAAVMSDLHSSAVLIATSGSTGRAKVVNLSKKALIAAAEASAERLGWMDDDRWLLSLSLCHIGGLSIATRCLLARRPVVLGEPRGDAAELTRLIERHDVTLVSLVSTQLHRLLSGDFDLGRTKLRILLLGGMQTDPWLIAAARTRGMPVLATYGMTETASQIATQLPTDLGSLIGPCHDVGHALSNVELKIVNDEIVVRGPILFDGYVGEIAEVDSMRGPNTIGLPLRHGLFHTGDWGRLDSNGRLTVVGRTTDRIVTGGENVAPAEVELVLETIPAIERACVFGVPEAVKGEQVAAAIILREGYALDLAEFELCVTERLASFKRPRALAIMSEFAVTATGKLDRATTARTAMPQLQIMEHRRSN